MSGEDVLEDAGLTANESLRHKMLAYLDRFLSGLECRFHRHN